MGISCFVVCCNEEKHIARCLSSIIWCDEIIVIDSGSTDRTLEIARQYTDRVIHREWSGYVNQKRAGLEQCTQEWVLNIDADEEVSPGLRAEIEQIASQGASCDGYYINRVVYYLGRWWRKGGWYPEYRLRFCRRNVTTWGGRDPHEKAVVPGQTAFLTGEIYHYTYEDTADHVARLNAHSSSAAQSLFSEGQRSSLSKIFFNPLIRLVKFYFLRKGYREGIPGLMVAFLEAHYVFLKYLKLWELARSSKRAPGNPES